MARGRKKKSVLNQKTEEPKEAAKLLAPDIEAVQPMSEPVGWVQPEIEQNPEEIVEKMVEDMKKVSIITKKEESEMISLKVSGEKLAEALEKKEEVVPEEIVDEDEEVVDAVFDEVPHPVGVRSLDEDVVKRLSRKDLRYFQRTGKMPK